MANARPDPTLAEFETGPPDYGYSSPHRLPDFNHTYPIMAGLFDQQPTRARVIASWPDAAGHLCGRRGRACGRTLTLLCSLYGMRAYHQHELPKVTSGDYPTDVCGGTAQLNTKTGVPSRGQGVVLTQRMNFHANIPQGKPQSRRCEPCLLYTSPSPRD